ncbi:MAG: hypothetical protein NZO58_04155, partial [Gemmataceae bacterium]|nr:hypothetical protein [Gemmataceae bacterium]
LTMLHELRAAQEELRKQTRGDQRALQHENQQLRETVESLQRELADRFSPEQVEALFQEQLDEKKQLIEQIKMLEERLSQVQNDAGATAAPTGELARLQAENAELRALLQSQLFKSAEPAADNDELRRENELLRQLLQEKEKFLEEIQNLPNNSDDGLPLAVREQLESQAKDLEMLRGEVARLEALLAQERSRQTAIHGSPFQDDLDLDAIEAELNNERRQLQEERAKLNKEIELLKQRNAELDEATRDMEMELSRERAALARERARLDRLRDEIKCEMERLARDGSVRESLQSVQRLREEMRAAGIRR